MVIAVGHVAWIRSAVSAGPDVRVRRHAVDEHRQSRIGYLNRIVNDDHMLPLADLVRNQTRDIEPPAAPDSIIHSAVPTDLFAANIGIIRLALKENPSLPVRAGRGITVIDRR